MKITLVWLLALVALTMLFIHPMLTLLPLIACAIVWHGHVTKTKGNS
jgi:hypothetical protein